MKVFIDTNVLLDFMCKREPFYGDAYTIFRMAATHKIEISASALTIVNAQYTVRKYGYTTTDVSIAIKNLLSLIEISPIDGTMISDAYDLDNTDKEDVLQFLSAKHVGADYIISRDKTGFTNSPVTVLTPTEFLNL